MISVVMTFITLAILLIVGLKTVSCDGECELKTTCHDCIQELGCSWCSDPKGNFSHCNSDRLSSSFCNTQLVKVIASKTIDKNLPLSSTKGRVVQLRPQMFTINVAKNQEYHLDFEYQQAENYPVDLYYLMDLSYSMLPHKTTLGRLGQSISFTMRSLTNNFRLGFGSFVDKPTVPYVNLAKTYNFRSERVKPYSFKNHLSLNENYQEFNNKVQSAIISENVDTPEGGLDALMQAIVCKKEIGWRPQARHLLVFSTDASFHIAGDGRLGGVIEPNDGQCHMINDEYVAALKYDYPSISHINHVAKINNINLVFAVSNKKNINATYHYLSEKIENSNVGTLSTTSSNVVQLISDNYNKIVDSVTMTSNAPDHISVSFTSNCPSKIPNGCTDVKLGKIIRFRATIKAEKCVNNETIIIKPAGLDEQITVKLNVICKCDCESPKHHSFEASSPSCSRHGDFACGVCNCNGGRYGARCECDGDSDTNEDVTQCQETENGPVCSDAGTCRCNECVCNVRENPDEKIYGKYCGCTNYNCHRSRGILCGGHGECDCGKCKCHDGWIGDACDCFLGNSTCIAPGSEEVCSGHGTCNCGSCKCDQDGNRYTGTYCQDCTTCRPRCEELSPCVECQAYKTGSLNATCETCTNSLELVDKFDEEFNPEVKDCQVLLNHGCRMHFQYSYDQNQLIVVRALKEKICSVPPLAWIIGVMVTVIIAGIVMLLIWKICTTIHDRREYSKFEEEKKKLKWHSNQNPLYKGATSSYANPAFKRQSVKT